MNSARRDTIDYTLAAVTAVAVAIANYMIFFYVPNEKVMGAVQRTLYFHVGAAVASYVVIGVVFVASLAYLATRKQSYDALLHAAGEVGFVFCTMFLGSGMIWGQVAWGRAFTWEPRLVTSLLLWLIFLAFVTLRTFGDPRKIGVHSAVLGILGSLTVPAVVFSIKLLPRFAQMHPQVGNEGLKVPAFQHTLFFSMFALTLLAVTLIRLRTRIALLEQR